MFFFSKRKIEEGGLLSLSKDMCKKNVGTDVSAWDSSGGLETMWTEELFSLENSFEMHHRIFTELWHIPSKISLASINLYVPVNSQEKRECWNSPADFLAASTISSIIVDGDLNITLDPKEKKGGVCERDPMHNMVEHLILIWDLIDFKPKIDRYT